MDCPMSIEILIEIVTKKKICVNNFNFSHKLLKLTVPRNNMNRKLKENKQCKV